MGERSGEDKGGVLAIPFGRVAITPTNTRADAASGKVGRSHTPCEQATCGVDGVRMRTKSFQAARSSVHHGEDWYHGSWEARWVVRSGYLK